MPKVKVWVETGKVGSRTERIFDIDDEKWSELNQWERDDYMRELMSEMINWDYVEEANHGNQT